MNDERGTTDDAIDPTRGDHDEPSLRDHPWLFVIAVGLPLVELAVLTVTGQLASAPVAPQLTASPAFGVFHDYRWLAAYHPEWWVFGVGVAAIVVFRGLITALMVWTAWPRDVERPTFLVAFRRGALFAIGAMIVLTPWLGFLYGAGVVSLSWLWFAAIPPALLTAAIVHRGAIAGQWWRLPTWRTFLWTGLEFVVLSLGAGAIVVGGPWTAWPAVVLVGVFNAWTWYCLIRASVLAKWDQPIPGLAIPVFVCFMALSVVAAAVLFGHGGTTTTGAPEAPSDEGDQPVLIVRGLGSRWNGTTPDVLRPPYTEFLFSYEGMEDGERLPYEPPDTYRSSLWRYATLMDAQVTALHERTGQPVDIVGDSEGTLVTQAFLAANPHAPVGDVVLTSPLLHSTRAYYPPQTDGGGWGIASGWMWRGAIGLVRSVSGFGPEADSELARSMLDNGPIMREIETCTFGQRTALIIPWAAASVAPYDLDAEPPTQWVPAMHAGILSEQQVNRLVRTWLSGEPLPAAGTWEYIASASRAVTSGWHVPLLDLDLPRAWQEGASRTAGDHPNCEVVQQLIAQEVAEATG